MPTSTSLKRLVRRVAIPLCLIGSGWPLGAEAPVDDCARLAHLDAARSPEALHSVRAAIEEQLRFQAPIAFLEGFWVSPIDLSPALAAADPSGGGGPLPALAFTDHLLRDAVPLPFVGDFPHLPPSTEPLPRILLLPLAEGADAVLEYLAPPGECHYFCSDPAGWDFDHDGHPNRSDPDDDGDGVADGADAFPYWPQASEAPQEGTFYRGFTGKFSHEVAEAVLALRQRLHGVRGEGRGVLLGPVAEQGVLYLLLLDCPSQPTGCPDPDDPAVRYASRDPQACAALRFYCEPGQIAFYDRCGCGCRPADSPEADP